MPLGRKSKRQTLSLEHLSWKKPHAHCQIYSSKERIDKMSLPVSRRYKREGGGKIESRAVGKLLPYEIFENR